MEFLLCYMTILRVVTQGLHNHMCIFILIRLPLFVSMASICPLVEFNNVIQQSGYLFLRPNTLVPFFLSSFLFLSQDFSGREIEMIRIGA